MTLHKKENRGDTLKLNCCVQGVVVPLEKVEDEIFSTKILGDGFGIVPQGKNVLSPCRCTVRDVTNNGLAVTLRTDDGLHLIVHFGFKLDGMETKAVKLTVTAGDRLEAGDKIGEIDIEDIKSQGLDATVCVIITNSDNLTFSKVMAGEKVSGESAFEYLL